MGVDLWPRGYSVVVSESSEGETAPLLNVIHGSHNREQTYLPEPLRRGATPFVSLWPREKGRLQGFLASGQGPQVDQTA